MMMHAAIDRLVTPPGEWKNAATYSYLKCLSLQNPFTDLAKIWPQFLLGKPGKGRPSPILVLVLCPISAKKMKKKNNKK